MSLVSPAGDRGAAAAFEAGLCVVKICRGDVRRLKVKVAVLSAQVAGGGLHSVVVFGPERGIPQVIHPIVLVLLARPQGDITFGNGDLIRDRDAAMVLNAGAWQ